MQRNPDWSARRRAAASAGGTARPRPQPASPPRTRPTAPHTSRWTPLVAALLAWKDRDRDLARLWAAGAVGLLGALLLVGAALADGHLHRGMETGAERPFVVHPTGRELATNADLTALIPERLDQPDAFAALDGAAAALGAAGFRYVRQPFAWSAIEPNPGEFAWERHDALVDALVRHRLVPVAVLADAPDWARSPSARDATDAPPTDPDDWAAFVAAVADRYSGRVRFYQLWDLPNRPDRWGGTVAPAAAYQELLAVGSNAVRTAAPGPGEATVLLAELDPAPAAADAGDDLAYLRDLYRAGAAGFFDILAVRLDGGDRPPEDRRAGAGRASLSRATLFRDLLVDEGDAAKPIWATRYGWEAGEATGIDGAEQATYTVAGLERARAEWPWMGPMFAWGLLPAGAAEIPPGRALLDAGGVSRPVYGALVAFGGGPNLAAPTGYVPLGVAAVDLSSGANWTTQPSGGPSYLDPTVRTTAEPGQRVTYRFRGSGLIVFLRLGPQAGRVEATLDGAPLPGWSPDRLDAFRAQDLPLTLASGLDGEATHELTLTLLGDGELTVGGAVVTREVPTMWPVVLLAAAGALALFAALREAVYVVAIRSGHLQRRRGVDLWPALPHLAAWQPSRRA